MSRIACLILLFSPLFGCGRSSLVGSQTTGCAGVGCVPQSDMGGLGGFGDGGGAVGDGFSDGGITGDGGDLCGDPSNCMLPACVGDPRCHVPGTEICNNCVDDNDNGLIDCADPQCVNFPGCQPGHTCDPNHVDCTDPQ